MKIYTLELLIQEGCDEVLELVRDILEDRGFTKDNCIVKLKKFEDN